MERTGYIKLHRCLLENPISQKPIYAWLWTTLLLLANHKPNKFMWNGNIIIIKEGEVLTGRKELSVKTGIPETTIEDILKYLERQHQIRQQKTTKFRIITIIEWQKYQNSDTKSDNKPTTSRQQADTNKNEENEENEKKKDRVTDKSVSPDFKDLMGYYHNLVLNTFGFKPEIRAKDGKILKTALEKHGAEKVKKIIYWYLGQEKADKLGIDMSICLSGYTINQYHQNENK